MRRFHILFSLNSLVVVLVSIERFSFTTHILLSPYQFLRLHEAFQMTILILATVVIAFFLLREVTVNFSFLAKSRRALFLAVLFIIGIYFYASGNAFHELASFMLNQYCNVNAPAEPLCQGLFFNDYYTGNVLYFVGAFLFTIALVLLEVSQPYIEMTRRDLWLLLPNCLIYALAIVAYAAFDRVLVGLIYSLFTTVIVIAILLISRKTVRHLPFTDYTALTYLIGTVAACLIRFL
ncbi:MAG TPA: hypothetical protein VKV37_02610 [Ktedonobacteraceae bacterium]|jgi:hypothetical protein|nr:hypothetical protein [Ktedonobacteraceae bacterium]